MSVSLNNTNIKELYIGSTKINQVYLGSLLVYKLVTNVVLYENLNTYTSGSNLFNTGALSTDKNIIAITFQLSTSTSNQDSYFILRSAADNSKIIWNGNARNYGSYSYASIFRSSSSSWNGITNMTTGSDGAKSSNVFYLPNSSAAQFNTYKFIFDTSNHTVKCYISGKNVVNGSYTGINPLNFWGETGGSGVTVGNLRVIACDTFEAALAI